MADTCRECGAKMVGFAASDGGSYIMCEATSGSGSHEFVIKALRADLEQAEADNAALAEALAENWHHAEPCRTRGTVENPRCVCGLDDLLDSLAMR